MFLQPLGAHGDRTLGPEKPSGQRLGTGRSHRGRKLPCTALYTSALQTPLHLRRDRGLSCLMRGASFVLQLPS